MSFTANTTVNSGPIIIRTVLDDSSNNAYLLGQYDRPIDNNYVLMTSNNGLLVPSRDLHLNTVYVTSTITGNVCRTTTLSTMYMSTASVSSNLVSTNALSTWSASCSSLNTHNITTSTIYSNGFTLESGSIRYNVPTKIVSTGIIYSLNSMDWWGKYIFVTNVNSNMSLSLPLSDNLPPDGTFMYIINAASGHNTTINNLITGDRTLTYTTAAHVIYQSSLNRWFSIS